jgi:hypothetical protein
VWLCGILTSEITKNGQGLGFYTLYTHVPLYQLPEPPVQQAMADLENVWMTMEECRVCMGIWSKVPFGIQGQSPGQEDRGRSPPKLKAFLSPNQNLCQSFSLFLEFTGYSCKCKKLVLSQYIIVLSTFHVTASLKLKHFHTFQCDGSKFASNCNLNCDYGCALKPKLVIFFNNYSERFISFYVIKHRLKMIVTI